jgi:6-phosphofructokinase 1
MGRAAGHLALGIGKAAAATVTIIPEEFRSQKVTLNAVCDIILGSIIKRVSHHQKHGVVILAEGLLEAIGADALTAVMGVEAVGKYGRVTRDPHGHLRLGEIDFGRMITDLLSDKMESLGLKFTCISKDLGYELRSADPIPFDAEYTRDLGYGAFKFLRSPAAAEFGAIISYAEGRMVPLRFEDMIDPRTNRLRNRRVDVDGEGYECARRYMIRLEKSDFTDAERLQTLAAVVKMKPEQFRDRFGYLCGSQ